MRRLAAAASWRRSSPRVLARRGHEVRLLSSDPPIRLGDFQAGLAFHAVQTPGYPLFREPQYLLSLTSKIVEVARQSRLDIVHAHYAIPHATAAYLAGRILAAAGGGRVPRVITTLHGTDVTLIGSDGLVRRSGRILHRSIGRRHRGLREPARRHLPAPAGARRHSRHPELPGLREASSDARRAPAGALPRRRPRDEAGDSRLELPGR